MKIRHCLLGWLAAVQIASLAAGFTPLTRIEKTEFLKETPAYPNASLSLRHLIDGDLKTDFASRDLGTNTVVEIGFGKTAAVRAIRHVDRNDPATVSASVFAFFDEAGREVAVVPVTHVNKRSGETFHVLEKPVTASRVKWQVTKLGSPGLRAAGGADLSFYTAEAEEAVPSRSKPVVRVFPFVEKSGRQPVRITIEHPYTAPAEVTLKVSGEELARTRLVPGGNTIEAHLPAVKSKATRRMEVLLGSASVASAEFAQPPVREMTVYMVPHSHTDIGYTEIQTAIEDKQVKNLVDGMAAAKRTASYPEGARFTWNVEVGWAADLFLQRMDEKKRAEFIEAVRNGQVSMNGMYLNELTGLCRPEELVQLFRFATRMAEVTGVPIDTAMISDVPGYTWGTVTAMAEAGIKYFSTAPNYFDRIGDILKVWENKPFYWVGPDGKSKVLVWIPFWGYAMSHVYSEMSPRLVADLFDGLEKRDYPYDIAYVRWAGHGDNAVPDPAICEFVRDWNAKYAWPKFIISSSSEPFRAFEKRYGSKLPEVRGDWSPYWEDGAGSSALETALNRNTSDRLSSAATLFAMLKPRQYPLADFEDAWRSVLLYSEHTWGAWCSVSEPERKDTIEQWEIKKSYAEKAEHQTSALLGKALADAAASSGAIQVLNTLSWTRDDLVIVPAELSKAGDAVLDGEGRPVPSQRLGSGELAFVAEKVPAFSARNYTVAAGQAGAPKAAARASGTVLENGRIRVRIDEQTGAVVELTAAGIKDNFVDASGGEAVNDYIYFIGDDPKQAQRNGKPRISVGEKGPLVASLVIESDAPGTKTLRREVRLVAGRDYVELVNDVDKAKLQAKSYHDKDGKESVNFAFPFNVPNGEMLVDVPLGAFRPEKEQMPSACKNWLTVGRWVEVANRDRGITWVTLDAPLIEVGHLSANLLNSQTNPDVWRKKIDKTQKFYSWVMNNHWGTNYRAYQEGLTRFRYILRPHDNSADPAEATRFATQFSSPLWVRAGAKERIEPLLRLSNEDVVVVGLKPSDDGKALILRLFGASGKDASTKLEWGAQKPKAMFLSDTSEKPGRKVNGKVSVPGYGLVTLRVELE